MSGKSSFKQDVTGFVYRLSCGKCNKNDTNMKNSRGKSAGRCFWKPFFHIRENFFQSFCTKFLSWLYMISMAYKIPHCLSANHNPELQCVICTGITLFCTVVTLFALVLHLNCTTLSHSESSNLYVYY